MTRKKAVELILFLLIVALAALYFLLPRPVLRDPEHTVITAIVIEKDPYYQEGAEDKFVWTPETAEDQALARDLVDYLAGCKQTGTLLREPGFQKIPVGIGSCTDSLRLKCLCRIRGRHLTWNY